MKVQALYVSKETNDHKIILHEKLKIQEEKEWNEEKEERRLSKCQEANLVSVRQSKIKFVVVNWQLKSTEITLATYLANISTQGRVYCTQLSLSCTWGGDRGGGEVMATHPRAECQMKIKEQLRRQTVKKQNQQKPEIKP